MRRTFAVTATLALLAAAAPLAPAPVAGQELFAQEESYDYWHPQREMIRRGQQAVFMCNGLFTSNRTLEQVFAQELAFRGLARLRINYPYQTGAAIAVQYRDSAGNPVRPGEAPAAGHSGRSSAAPGAPGSRGAPSARSSTRPGG